MDKVKVLHDLKAIAVAMNNVKDAMVFLTKSIDSLYKDMEMGYEIISKRSENKDRQ